MRVASRAGNPIRRMCTAVAEEAPPGPFSLMDPTFQGVLGAFACTYIAVIRWQFKDKALAKEIAAHKAAKEAAAEPVAELSPIVSAVVEASAPTAAAPVLSARAAPAAGSSPADWNVAQTGAWLHTLELDQHVPAFKTHAVDGKLLLTLTEQDLYSVLNVVSPLHRKKITMGTAACQKVAAAPGGGPRAPAGPAARPHAPRHTPPQPTCRDSAAHSSVPACAPPQPSPSCATVTSTRERRPGDASPIYSSENAPARASGGRLRVVVQEVGRSDTYSSPCHTEVGARDSLMCLRRACGGRSKDTKKR